MRYFAYVCERTVKLSIQILVSGFAHGHDWKTVFHRIPHLFNTSNEPKVTDNFA